MTQAKGEALKLALDALTATMSTHGFQKHIDQAKDDAIAAIKQALAAPVQGSTCSETLRVQGKAYPRTCKKCGKGPCIGVPKQPPAQPAPVQKPVAWPEKQTVVGEVVSEYSSTDHYYEGWNDCLDACKAATPPTAQRQWVGLSQEEIESCYGGEIDDFARAIETKLKEKNT